ncbi:MAG: transposase [Chlorobi bacterium]|uniref:Transposase, IS3/IS911 family n=1 Tax=hydrothermal vent metagenome TaxID=652676 RepID=A0A3B0U9P1_9ZZZZ|nr:transposase [Chlorobiota bacterium]
MISKRFSEPQIYRILKENDEGASVSELIKKYKISQATFYNWKKKYKGLMISEISRLNKLEEENDKLKRMFAELSLENLSLKRILEKFEMNRY